MLRFLRIGRVVRLFTMLKSLTKLLTAVSHALIPVCNAFLILIIIASIYAILGTNFFRHRAPEYFGNFQASLFTMFQVLMGDSWASGVARGLFRDPNETEPDVALFFVTYILIASIMLLNVKLSKVFANVPLCLDAISPGNL